LEQEQKSRQQAFCAYYIGLNYKAINEFSQAIPYLQTTISLCKTLSINEQRALEKLTYLYLGICEEGTWDYDAGIAHLQKAILLFHQQIAAGENPANDENYFRAHLHLCHCLIMSNKSRIAVPKLLEIKQSFLTEKTSVELRAMLYQLLGIGQTLNKEFLAANESLLTADALYKQTKNEKQVAVTAQYLGVTYLNLNQYPTAIRYLSHAHEYFKRVDDVISRYFVRIGLSINYQFAGNQQLAQENLSIAINLIEECDTAHQSKDRIRAFSRVTNYFQNQLSSIKGNASIDRLEETLLKQMNALGLLDTPSTNSSDEEDEEELSTYESSSDTEYQSDSNTPSAKTNNGDIPSSIRKYKQTYTFIENNRASLSDNDESKGLAISSSSASGNTQNPQSSPITSSAPVEADIQNLSLKKLKK
jgi:tetratricopeptide (TPR) repeat protein